MNKLFLFLIVLTQTVFSQVNDKFIFFKTDSDFVISRENCLKYDIFPQFKNIYQGFIVKPFEREGYYAWIQSKSNGGLNDTIIWLEENDVNTLLQNLPDKPLNLNSKLVYNELINRAKQLSVMNARSLRPLNSDYNKRINGELVKDTTIRYNPDYIDEKEARENNLLSPRWYFTLTNTTLDKYSVIGKNGSTLILSNNNEYFKVNINEINSVFYKPANLTWLGIIVGIPAGGLAGYYAGKELWGKSYYNDDLTLVGTTAIGAVLFGIAGGVLMNTLTKGTSEEIHGESDYERYFDFDRKTYFAIPEIKVDSSMFPKKNVEEEKPMVKKDTVASTPTLASTPLRDPNSDLIPVRSRKTKTRPVDTTVVSIGVGFFEPLNVNLHVQAFIDDNFGLFYTGFPVALSFNDDEDMSRAGLLIRFYHSYKFRHNMGFSVGYGKKNINYYYSYPDYTSQKKTLYYPEFGVFYELSFYGFFAMTGFYYKIYEHSYSYETSTPLGINFQIGYRITF